MFDSSGNVLERRALLIGVSQFRAESINNLPAVQTDLELLSTALQSPDGPKFDIVDCSGTDRQRASQNDLVADLEIFLSEPGAAPRLNLVYVASHGFVDTNGTLRIVPESFQADRPLSTSIPVTFIAECLQHRPEDSLVLILDCCYADAGSWEILRNQKRPFQLQPNKAKSYCVIASCRADEPAWDGGFTPEFAAALQHLEPEPGEKTGVTVERIFDYAAERTVERCNQTPKLWLSRSVAIPLGRRYGGIRAFRSAVKALYDYLEDHPLLDPPDPNPYELDFVEHRQTIAGLRNRIGLCVFDNASATESIQVVTDSLTQAVRDDVIDNGIVIVTDATDLEHLSTERVAIRSFLQLRRELLPLVKYLEHCVAEYEDATDSTATSLYRKGHYISLSAHVEGQADRSFTLDERILDWATQEGDDRILTILGEFGAGKTTTMRYIFWQQAKRYLEAPTRERLPVLVNLREFNKRFDMELLVERTVSRGRSLHQLSYEAIATLNQRGRILWLLDGFDEMAVRVTYQDMHHNFSELLKLSSPGSKLLLTCRTAFFKSREEVEEVLGGGQSLYEQLTAQGKSQYQVLYVNPLNLTEIEAFVRTRIRAKSDEAQSSELDAQEFLTRLNSTPAIRNLASRPILLEMIVVTLPALLEQNLELNLYNLYNQYTTRLLKRDAWRFVTNIFDNRVRFCCALAWHFFETSTYQITYRQLPDFIKGLFPEFAQKAEEFEQLERAIRTTSFLTRDEAGNFSFAHKSFMEFFAASHVVAALEQGNGDILSERIFSGEIIRFATDHLETSEQAQKTIEAILKQSKFSLSMFLRQYLLPRILPVRKKANIRFYVQRKKWHVFWDVFIPFLIWLSLSLITVLRRELGTINTELLYQFIWLFSLTFTGAIVFHFCMYSIQILRGRTGIPIQQLNINLLNLDNDFESNAKQIQKIAGDLDYSDQEQTKSVISYLSDTRINPSNLVEKIQIVAVNFQEKIWKFFFRVTTIATVVIFLFIGSKTYHDVLLYRFYSYQNPFVEYEALFARGCYRKGKDPEFKLYEYICHDLEDLIRLNRNQLYKHPYYNYIYSFRYENSLILARWKHLLSWIALGGFLSILVQLLKCLFTKLPVKLYSGFHLSFVLSAVAVIFLSDFLYFKALESSALYGDYFALISHQLDVNQWLRWLPVYGAIFWVYLVVNRRLEKAKFPIGSWLKKRFWPKRAALQRKSPKRRNRKS